MYREHGCIFNLDLKHCYFTPRLGYDRAEIATEICNLIKQKQKFKEGLNIAVLFAGVAPYPIIIAKFLLKNFHDIKFKILAIELSKIACFYAKENIKLNKLEPFIEIKQMDVGKVKQKIKQKFDLVIACKPRINKHWLSEVFYLVQHDGIIYYYFFAEKNKIKEWINKIKEIASKEKIKIKLSKPKMVREVGPHIYHLRLKIDLNS